jgi:hypothetical protein
LPVADDPTILKLFVGALVTIDPFFDENGLDRRKSEYYAGRK